ncbi:helix-turn-helix transcriptional regulator, partial [Coprobacillus cateniformis]|nr:helix-turn-helix transcriptional regulator [Coprobacillus cateniformis]
MNYQKALEDAIIYIENHLEEDIKVEEVAHFVGYSYFHFNRQFQALIGESVGNYIKKRRLANAAHQLLY